MNSIFNFHQIIPHTLTAVSSESDDEEEKWAGPQISIDHTPPTDRKASAPAMVSRIMQKIQQRSATRPSMDLSPRTSPQSSPRGTSPSHSPSHSPRSSPFGVRRGLKVRGQRSATPGVSNDDSFSSQSGGRKIGRAPTLLPRVTMKGQSM